MSTTAGWILIVFMMSPGGDLMEKIPVDMPSKGACEKAMYNLPRRGESPMGVKFVGKCVTAKHWKGERTMKDVPLD